MLYLFIFLNVFCFIFMSNISYSYVDATSATSLRLAGFLRFLGDDVDEIDRYLRKVAHIIVFAIFTILFCKTMQLAKLPIWSMSLVYVFTVLDEATKPLVKGRHFSLNDIMLNLIGTFVGILIIMVI